MKDNRKRIKGMQRLVLFDIDHRYLSLIFKEIYWQASVLWMENGT